MATQNGSIIQKEQSHLSDSDNKSDENKVEIIKNVIVKDLAIKVLVIPEDGNDNKIAVVNNTN